MIISGFVTIFILLVTLNGKPKSQLLLMAAFKRAHSLLIIILIVAGSDKCNHEQGGGSATTVPGSSRQGREAGEVSTLATFEHHNLAATPMVSGMRKCLPAIQGSLLAAVADHIATP